MYRCFSEPGRETAACLTLSAGGAQWLISGAVFQSVAGPPYRGLGDASTPTTLCRDSASSRSARMPADSSPTSRIFFSARPLPMHVLRGLGHSLSTHGFLLQERAP